MLHSSSYSRGKSKGLDQTSLPTSKVNLWQDISERKQKKKKLFVYMLHKRSVSILRALPCLQRHVLPSPAGPGRGGRLSCPWGRCSCTASCAMATLTAPVLTAYGPCAPASPHSSRKQSFLPPSCGDRDVTLWTREGLWNKRSEVSRALCLAPPKLSSMDNGYVIQPCLSKFTKQKKKPQKPQKMCW